MKVLVVEDLLLAQMAAKAVLRNKFQYKVDIANTGAEARQLAAKKSYDFIFMDIMLGDDSPDGYEVTRQILQRKNKQQQKPNVIALTAYDDYRIRSKCKRAGMCDFIVKPLDINKLNKVIGDNMIERVKYNLKLLHLNLQMAARLK